MGNQAVRKQILLTDGFIEYWGGSGWRGCTTSTTSTTSTIVKTEGMKMAKRD
ncbi:hypothetical protein BN132_1487 [Cronobacter turicensis 564]|nr:hypothetical protein BN132_1487 [Cronobacter turicensis 564]